MRTRMKMKFHPKNRYMLVERLAQPKKEGAPGFEIPEHLQESTKATGTEVVRVVDANVQTGSQTALELFKPGTLIAVEATMLEEFQHEGATYVLIKDQHVKGKFE